MLVDDLDVGNEGEEEEEEDEDEADMASRFVEVDEERGRQDGLARGGAGL
jgi:hypothetical protein